MIGYGKSQRFHLPEPVTRRRLEPWIAKEMAGPGTENIQWASLDLDGFDELEHPSKILRERSEPHHRLGDLYDDVLERDGFLCAIYGKLDDAFLALERLIDPGADTPQAIEAAALCRWALSRLKGLAIILRHLSGARPRGLAIAEMVWDVVKRGEWRGAAVPVALIDRPMRRFAFRRRDRALAVRHVSGERRFVVAPPGKFAAVQRGSLDTPWGRGELDDLYWLSWMTQHGAVYWSLAVERYADPIPQVSYPWKTGAEKANTAYQKLATTALDALRRGEGVSIPSEMEAALLEVASSGGLSYTEYMAFWNRIKANKVLAEIRTSGLHQGHGSFAAESVSADLFASTVKLAARDLAADVKDEIFAPITRANFGATTPVPRLRIEVTDSDDRRLRMEGLELARSYQLTDVPEDHVYRVLGVPRAQPGERAMHWPEPAAPEPAAPETAPPDSTDPESPDDEEAKSKSDPARSKDDDDRAPAVVASAGPFVHLGDLHLEDDAGGAPSEAAARQQELDALAALARAPWVKHWQTQRQRLESAWDDGTLATGEAYARVFQPAALRAQADRLHAVSVHGLGQGLRALAEEGLGPRLWRLETPRTRRADLVVGRPAHLDFASRVELAQQPGAEAYADGDAAAAWWADTLDVSRDVFLGLEDALRRQAFSIAGVEDLRLLRAVHVLVGEALASGWDRLTFREQLAALYAQRGLAETSAWHADLILQNAVAHAAGAVRWRQTVGNPAAHRLVPYLRWNTAGDLRVRQRPSHDHNVMEGRVFATSHPIWRTWWSPAGHACRCWVSLILAPEARRLGLLGDEPTGPWPPDRHGAGRALPDPGFRGVAGPEGQDAIQATVDEQLASALDEALASRGAGVAAPRYDAALEALLRALGLRSGEGGEP